MDRTVIETVTEDSLSDQRVLAYVEELKQSGTAWKACMDTLTSNSVSNVSVKFLMLQVIENFIKTRYSVSSVEDQLSVRQFLCKWIQCQCLPGSSPEKSFIANKVAQLFSLVFVQDYPHRWPSFFSDLINTLSFGTQAVDNYVKVLLAIDTEVADKEISRTKEESERNSMIKNAMRESCVPMLVESWHQIIVSYNDRDNHIVNQCLQVIGAYISWIDITLIMNEIFVKNLIKLISVMPTREEAVSCFNEIVKKGMEPLEKLSLIETLIPLLEPTGVFVPNEDDDLEYAIKAGKLITTIGVSLLECYKRMEKDGTTADLQLVTCVIDKFVPVVLRSFGGPFDDVSAITLEFFREYLHMMKGKPVPNQRVAVLKELLCLLTVKSKFDPDFDFDDGEGEDESLFYEFRKQLKVLFENIASVDKILVMEYVYNYISQVLGDWQNMRYQEIEIAITLFYYVGEAVPATGGNHFSANNVNSQLMEGVMTAILTSGVSAHPHHSVKLAYLETVVRFEKYFIGKPDHIPDTLMAFIDGRGMRNSNLQVRSRASYLLSRMVKNLKPHIQPWVAKTVINLLHDYLIVTVPGNCVKQEWLSNDDQLFIYEAAGILIMCCDYPTQQFPLAFQELVEPLLRTSNTLVVNLSVENSTEIQNEITSCLCHCIGLVTRTSKAFSSSKTMKNSGCSHIYITALKIFLTALEVPLQTNNLQSSVRQFLHRMVVCLDDELLPFIPIASQNLLKNSDIIGIQDYIPLIVQIITKFKKSVTTFLQQTFVVIVDSIVCALAAPVDENSEDSIRTKQQLQRSFYQFISVILHNNLTEVLTSQPNEILEQVMNSIIRGAVDFPDPVAQKSCFAILRKLVELWGGERQSNGFTDFLYKNIVPACFLAPLKSTFDLTDAQSLLALNEVALCIHTIWTKEGEQYIIFLTNTYMPSIQISKKNIDNFCSMLKSDFKVFRKYFKTFIQHLRT